LKNVTSGGKTRKNEAQKRSLHGVNEHFKLNFDTELASAVVFQQPAKAHDPDGHFYVSFPKIQPIHYPSTQALFLAGYVPIAKKEKACTGVKRW
jgi:hypothetical protein